MNLTEAVEEYKKAQKAGQKELRDLTARGLNAYPAVLDELLPDISQHSVQELPVQEIPIERIIGVKSAGRVTAFTAGFLPLLDPDTEFGTKWIALCGAHLSEVGIRDPITVYEYLCDFYVLEGNKRVSVLKHFGAATIPAVIKRVIPTESDDPAVKAYGEFLDFYKHTKLYSIKLTKPGEYAKLLAFLGREKDEDWTTEESRAFSTLYHRFREAFSSLGGEHEGLSPASALLKWLEVYPFSKLSELSSTDLKKSLSGLWSDVKAGEPVSVQTMPDEDLKPKHIIASIISPPKAHLNVAFINQRDVSLSLWTLSHDQGRQYLQQALGDKVTARSYFNADNPEIAESLIERAVTDGAEAVFTTTPSMLRPTLKVAVKYPKVKFFNCSADVPFSSVRGYYFRAYEGKFITGAIAGAMAKDNRIGYVASYPILGVPASINAFALGAQITNPDARVVVRWSCLMGDNTENLAGEGFSVVSNRDVPTMDDWYLKYGEFGTFSVSPAGEYTPLGSPCWVWGSFYEKAVRAILAGSLDSGKAQTDPVNYWLGMDSGVIDVNLSDELPDGLRFLAENLRRSLKSGELDPFKRVIRSQDGTLKNDGTVSFTADEILHMDWLCDNVEGRIPEYEEIRPMSRELVRELGVHKAAIPPEKEAAK
ncbi:MAG: BMP family ABC transporter substrate-binding protein [Oscillospiraceae bacterium]|nr:BMP family ABC transporter substrate-binding protein [Oscillospiraceae bacterium]